MKVKLSLVPYRQHNPVTLKTQNCTEYLTIVLLYCSQLSRKATTEIRINKTIIFIRAGHPHTAVSWTTK